MSEKPSYEVLEQRIIELESRTADPKNITTSSNGNSQIYMHCFEYANIGVCIVKPDGDFIKVNNRMVELFGYSKKEFEGMNVDDVSHPEDIAISKEIQRKTKAGENEQTTFQKRYIHKKGHMFWGKVSNTIIKTDDGKLLYFVTHFLDITDSKKELERSLEYQMELGSLVDERTAELSETIDALKKSEEQFRLVTETIEDVFWMSTPGITKMIFVSSAYEKIWNKSIETLYKSPRAFLDNIHSEDLAQYLSTIDTYHAKGKAYQCEYRIMKDPSSIIWIRERGFPIFDDQGNVRFMTGLCTDITDKKQAQNTLEVSEKRFRQLFENIKIGVAVYEAIDSGKDFVFKDFNKAAEKIDQISKEDLIGKGIKEVFPNVTDFGLLSVLQRVWRTGEPENHPFSHYEDSRIAGWRDNFVFRLSSGEVMVCYEDVTQKKQAEETIRKNESFLKSLLGAIPIPVFYKNTDGRYIGCNKAFEHFSGRNEADLKGKSVFDINPPDLAGIYFEKDNELFKSGGKQEYESQILNYSGDKKDVVINKAVFHESDGNIGGLIGTILDITKQKKAENALIAMNQKLEAVIEFLPDPTFVIDNQGIVQTWNHAIETLTGIPGEQMVGKKDYEYSQPFYGHKRPMLIDLVLGREKGFEEKYPFFEKRPDGALLAQVYCPELKGGTYLFSTAGILYDESGNPSGAIESLRDISDLKKAEMAIRENELKFRNLFNSIRDAILITDVNRKIVGCNPAFTDLFGYPEAEILGKPTIFVYENEEQFLELGQKLKKNIDNPAFLYTVNYRKKSGDSFPGETGVYYLRDTNGEITGFIGLIRNIEERIEAEKNLRQTKDRLKSLVDNLFDSVLVTNLEGVTWFANPAAQTLFGKKEDEMVGMELGFPISLNEAFNISIMQQEAGPRQVEARAALTDWEGQSAYLISMHDITEKVKAEEERDEINLQLQQSQKIESIGRLAGGVAHDFNNMLSIILGYGQELVRKLHKSDPLHDSASEIVKAGIRSAELTRQLLAFSRKQTLQPMVLNLNHIIKNIEKVLRRLIGEDIALETKFAKDLERVEVDPGQIEQVIMNLAVNARDAMPEGGNLIIETANATIDEAYLKMHRGAVPGSYAMISITDTGCGMDRETREKAFEPFYTTKEKDRGTGLGLSTVYGIVKQSGGSIWLYSEPGKGTTFKIYLPLTTRTLSNERIKKEDGPIKGKNELIIVVEDEPAFQKLCEKYLLTLNYRVKTASNGGEALLMIEEKKMKPDLILTDVVMPGMSGKILVNRLKKKLPDLKVLYMSGYTDDIMARHGILDNGIPFIQKPFTKNSLGEKVHFILNEFSNNRNE